MVELKLKIVGFRENEKLAKRLRNLNLSKWFKTDATKIVRDRLKESFERGVDRPRWKALHPFTKENKKGPKVMIESGRLMRSVTRRTRDSIYKADKRGLEIGSKLPYARIHQRGGKINVTPKMRSFLHWKGLHLKRKTKQVKIPKREFLFISSNMKRMLYGSMWEFIRKIINKKEGN